MHLCGGLGTFARACVKGKIPLERFQHCDTDPVATQSSFELLQRLREQHPDIISKDSVDAFSNLPADVTKITRRQIKMYVRRYGAPDLILADFPCQDLSRAGQRKGVVAGERSSLIFHIDRVIREFKSFGNSKFLVENVFFKEHLPEDYDIVCDLLGVQSLDFDAALVSPSHRLRSYWTDITNARVPGERRADLADILEPNHRPNVCTSSDFSPFACFNIAGEIRRKAPTLVAAGEYTYSYRSGAAWVVDIITGLLVKPSIEEKEQMVGLLPGDTACSIATLEDRHRMVGNIFDANVMAHFAKLTYDDALQSGVLLRPPRKQPQRQRSTQRPRSGAQQQRKHQQHSKRAHQHQGPHHQRPNSRRSLPAKLAWVGEDMKSRQPWLDSHRPSVPAGTAERPSDIKAYLVQRSSVYISCPCPKIPFRQSYFQLLDRIHMAKRKVDDARRDVISVKRLNGLPTALHWTVPPSPSSPRWMHELHRAVSQPTDRDDVNDVFQPGARLDVPSLRKLGFSTKLCDELETGEQYDLLRLPDPFERGNYGS